MTKKDLPDFTEHTTEERRVFEGKWLKVRRDTVRLPDGNEASREFVEHPGAVIIIPQLDDDTVIVEWQYRYPLHQHFYEFPAGKIDEGEEPFAAAKRELIEECGYEAGIWKHLATLHPSIGYSDEQTELYLARDLKFIGHDRDEGEFLEVIPMKIDDLLSGIRDGKITDVKVMAAMVWLKLLNV